MQARWRGESLGILQFHKPSERNDGIHFGVWVAERGSQNAFRVHDEGESVGKGPDEGQLDCGSVRLHNRTLAVRQHRETQAVGFLEFLDLLQRVGRDANHLAVLGAELAYVLLICLSLARAARSEGLRVEVNDDPGSQTCIE